MIKVHAIQTGKVKIKKFEAIGATNQISRMWQLLHTDNWTDWLPIYCWLVEHPEGPFLIDAGEIARVHEYGYLPDNIFFNGAAKYEVKREDEVDVQLAKLGYKVEQVKGIYLTHFHSDHVDGVYRFPKAKTFAAKEAYDFTLSSKGARFGYLKKNLPEWFQPEVFEFTNGREDVFTSSKKLSADGSIVAVPMPGHSIGHTAYIVKSENCRYIFSGDTTFNSQTLNAGIPTVILNNADARESVRKLREYALSPDVVVLCSHDPQAIQILVSKESAPD
jgi:glyoxylase-like metal-dependent hydrolase (beta-lactamase superfamily II)